MVLLGGQSAAIFVATKAAIVWPNYSLNESWSSHRSSFEGTPIAKVRSDPEDEQREHLSAEWYRARSTRTVHNAVGRGSRQPSPTVTVAHFISALPRAFASAFVSRLLHHVVTRAPTVSSLRTTTRSKTQPVEPQQRNRGRTAESTESMPCRAAPQ